MTRRAVMAERAGAADRSPARDHRVGGRLPEQPAYARSMFLAPAERYEVIVDLARYTVGALVVLKNLHSGNRTTDLLRFDVVRDAVDTSTVPDRLRTIRRIPEADATVQRRFRFHRGDVQRITT